MSGRVGQVIRIARQDLLDLVRVRKTWVALLLLPLINVSLIVVLPGVMTQREQARQVTKTYDLAAEGAPEDVAALASALAPARIEVDRTDDARQSVLRRGADLGVTVPEGAVAAFAGEGEVRLRAFVVGTKDDSRAALGRLVAEVERLRTAIATEEVTTLGLPPAVVRPIAPAAADLADTDRGARLDLGAALPLVLLLPLSGAIGMAAQRISAPKDQRVFEPLLLLPLRRPTILAGKAVAGFVIGAVTLPAIAAPLVLGRWVAIGGTGQKVSLPPSTITAIVGVAAVALVLLVAIGACAGAASRTSAELSSILPFVSFPVILLGMSLQFLGDFETGLRLLVVPLLGPVLVGRDLAAGVADSAHVVVGLGSTVVWAALLLVIAARLLEREAAVIRGTS